MARVLIIGSNRGIGLEICRQLVKRGDDVIATCRTSSDDLAALAGENLQTLEIHKDVDVTSRSSLDALADTLSGRPVDVLIVVAGILRGVTLEAFDADVVRRQFEVNALGPLQTVVALLPLLNDGSKVGLLTSRMGSLADNTSGGSYGYRMSKAALNMAGRSLSLDLHGRGIALALLHPGWVRTEMTGGTGHIDATQSAAGLITRIDELTLEDTGVFIHQSGERLPW